MTAVPVFTPGQIESLAKLLGDCGNGSEITTILNQVDLKDNTNESTKWRRLNGIFLEYQNKHNCANHIIMFVQAFLDPTRFTTQTEKFENYRNELNIILAFSGLEFGKDGQCRHIAKVKTLDEAEQRVQTIRAKLKGRTMHEEVLKYCKKELMQDNYFHAVFEATKGLYQRIRELSGVELDGAELIDKVFFVNQPLLAFTSLRKQSEQSEQKGFAMLLKGCFAAIRNPLAHEPKLLWAGEDDAADYLTLISLLHRKLDACVRTGLDNS
jgi:uncharacterized protein (TIGR02391 family)